MKEAYDLYCREMVANQNIQGIQSKVLKAQNLIKRGKIDNLTILSK
jgi:hypothetical protein